MTTSEFLVYLVEDDAHFLESAANFLRAQGYAVESYSSGESFLQTVSNDRSACLVTDYRMGGLSGLDIQKCLNDRGVDIPIVFISGHAGVGVAVEAMRQGAITLLEKPFSPADLVNSIEEAREVSLNRHAEQLELNKVRSRLSSLTTKERDVLWMMIEGHANKVVAFRLGISLRTVERRRHEVFSKTGVQSEVQLAELVNMAGWEKTDPTGLNPRESSVRTTR
ncbi:response regulator transcription factor [Planctomycetota bacterium]